jgi:hypothetical protein
LQISQPTVYIRVTCRREDTGSQKQCATTLQVYISIYRLFDQIFKRPSNARNHKSRILLVESTEHTSLFFFEILVGYVRSSMAACTSATTRNPQYHPTTGTSLAPSAHARYNAEDMGQFRVPLVDGFTRAPLEIGIIAQTQPSRGYP